LSNERERRQAPEDLQVDVPLHAIVTDDGKALRELFSGCSAVIACAGPFYLHGEPILAAAVDAGAHYLDTTGEQPFIRLALETYGPRAAESGTAVLSGMGFDYVPGDMLAALTAEGMGPLETIRLAYTTSFQPTRGTMLSALEMFKGGDLEFRNGKLTEASPAIARGEFDFGQQLGTKSMTRYPAGEQITVPRHVDTKRVETMLSADSITPGPLVRMTPLIMRPAAAAMKTPLKSLTDKLVSRLPEGASAEDRASATFVVACEAVAVDGRHRRGIITGNDVYGLTAALLVEAAKHAVEGRIRGSGGLAPAEAFDSAAFLSRFARFSLGVSVEPVADQ
jgi:short subunit dehydrogenase-like uncharacterized protein